MLCMPNIHPGIQVIYPIVRDFVAYELLELDQALGLGFPYTFKESPFQFFLSRSFMPYCTMNSYAAPAAKTAATTAIVDE